MNETFTRTWWKENKSWPNGLEPHAGRRTYHGNYLNPEEARAACLEWNSEHAPGRLSRKMEWGEE